MCAQPAARDQARARSIWHHIILALALALDGIKVQNEGVLSLAGVVTQRAAGAATDTIASAARCRTSTAAAGRRRLLHCLSRRLEKTAHKE